MKEVKIGKFFKKDTAKTQTLKLYQIAPGQQFYVKCPATKLDVTVARDCVSCDGLRGFSYGKRNLDCRGKAS